MRVYITGGANGIGREAATRLHDQGHDVAVLDVDAAALVSLPEGIETHEVDVRDEERVRGVLADEPLDVLVNNAGYQAWAAIEDADSETMERHFETNVYGIVYATQAALPALRERGGRVVNVTSMGSRFTAPYWGIYSATKHAARAITDELRMEVAPDDVDVINVEPGPVTTGFNENGLAQLETHLPDSVYAEGYREALETDDFGGASPEAAGEVLVEAVTSNRPGRRYTITWYPWLLPKLRVLLPARLWDWFVQQF